MGERSSAAGTAMSRAPTPMRMLFGAAAAALFALAIYTAVLIVRQQEELREVSRYNLTWMVTQAALQIDRLTIAVAALMQPNSGVTADKVGLAYDLAVNQVQLFEHGAPAAFVQADPDLRALAQDLTETIRLAQAE